MPRIRWSKRLAILKNRLYLYPAPEPLPHTRRFWLAMGLVTLAVLLFSAFFIAYLTIGHDAYRTNAEDMGIMDQAIWNTLHGEILHQTVCNIVSDTNCSSSQGLMRFAIHVEPILFPISLLYLVWPDPKTLLVLQTVVVALGAYPAFWIARLRLRSEFAGIAIALLYLLFPAQLAATIYDFHAVTLTASLLFFALYFMYTRRTCWFYVFALLAMACKEEVALIVIALALWSIIFQQRWRSGMFLTVLATCWAWVALVVLPHFYSPVGHALLASRYTGLGDSPEQIVQAIILHPIDTLKHYVFEPDRLSYLGTLFHPAAFLPLLSPWVLLLNIPTLAINLFSTNDQMHSPVILYHYNAEIVPLLIFGTIEGLVLILRVAQVVSARLPLFISTTLHLKSKHLLPFALSRRTLHYGLLTLFLGYTLFAAVLGDHAQDHMPFTPYQTWPQVTSHAQLAQQVIGQIPSTASVSAQSKLVSHVSHRSEIYLFPYGDGVTTPAYADYIFLDEKNGDIYPYDDGDNMRDEVNKVLQGGIYGVLSDLDGYLLLERGLAPTDGGLPDVVPPDAFSASFGTGSSSDSGQLLVIPQSSVTPPDGPGRMPWKAPQ